MCPIAKRHEYIKTELAIQLIKEALRLSLDLTISVMFFLTKFQPGPAGLALLIKLSKVFLLSGFVKKVTVSHTIVVIDTVINIS